MLKWGWDTKDRIGELNSFWLSSLSKEEGKEQESIQLSTTPDYNVEGRCIIKKKKTPAVKFLDLIF